MEMVVSVCQLSASLNWGRRGLRHLLEVVVDGRDALLFIAKTYSCWELTFASNCYIAA